MRSKRRIHKHNAKKSQSMRHRRYLSSSSKGKLYKKMKCRGGAKDIINPKIFSIYKLLFLTDGRIGGSYKLFEIKISTNGTVSELRKKIKKRLNTKPKPSAVTPTELLSKMILYPPEIMIGDDRRSLNEFLIDGQQLDQIASGIYIRFIDIAHDATTPINPIHVRPEHPLPPGWTETMEQEPPFRSIYTAQSGVTTFNRPINADGFPLRFPVPGRDFDAGQTDVYQYFDPHTRRHYFHNPTTRTSTYNHPPEDMGNGWWQFFRDHGRDGVAGPLPTFYHHPERRITQLNPPTF
jgi:hypothetical protein